MEQDFLMIGKYLRGELSKDELLKFNERMNQDADFTEEVKFQKDLSTLLEFKELLGEVDKQKESEGFFRELEVSKDQIAKAKTSQPILRKLTSKRLLLVAASITALLVISSVFYANKNYSDEKLCAIDLSIFDTSRITKSSGIQDDVFKPGFDFLEKEDYKGAVGFFQTIDAEHNAYIEAQFFLGLSKYNNGNKEEAISTFETILNVNNSPEKISIISLKQKSEWILAKVLISAKNEKGTELLNEIKNNDDHQFKDEAKYLLEQLKSVWRILVI